MPATVPAACLPFRGQTSILDPAEDGPATPHSRSILARHFERLTGETTMRIRSVSAAALALAASWVIIPVALAQKGEPIPHNQDAPPNPARSPQEAAKAMTVPPGFTVEVVASEPNIVNPVAMTFDERGRIWITESLEYPRSSAGPGRDRIKVLEDTDGDGVMDKFTIFAEGLNIPSGIAVGSGGVWVANAPDILFLQDTDGDGKADKSEVVVTGFGRDDTHELPNSLTWGPDGWLYGLNGVFNRSVVKHQGRTFDFTCALFRIHPKTRAFELFAEGTSNAWGVAWDNDGSAFLSACVIDHLWHLAETGYYHRQGGPYPPYTWKIGSIVDYKHQKAAYCGIHLFDSDAYPAEFRDKLYMGNIHGGCINVDGLTRNGSTYKGVKNPDFLTANDAWFMPVAQKTGPDGSLYILDWYDRYHCYQDARRDPEGIDRLKGRIYRVRYKDTPRAPKFDLLAESDVALINRLFSPNIFFRDMAQRILRERNNRETKAKLQSLVLSEAVPRKARLHALWTLVGADRLDPRFQIGLLAQDDPAFRAWGVRAAGNMRSVEPEVRNRILAMVRDPSRDVQLQVAIAARKVEGIDPMPVLLDVLSASGDDPLIPHIVWQNLHPLLEIPTVADAFAARVVSSAPETLDNQTSLLPRAVERLLGTSPPRIDLAAKLVVHLGNAADRGPRVADAARRSLSILATNLIEGNLKGDQVTRLREGLDPLIRPVLAGSPEGPLYSEAVLVASAWKDPASLRAARATFARASAGGSRRLEALGALVAAQDASTLEAVVAVLDAGKATSVDFRGKVLATLGRLDVPEVASVVLDHYAAMEPDLRPKAIELLTQRPAWSKALLKAIDAKAISKDALNLNQVRKLLASKDADLARSVKAIWGTVREGRNPAREGVIAQMRTTLQSARGDASAGAVVFKNVCAQCHKIYGEGQEVGPEITSNGRASFDQLLSNVFDPSLVIGEAFQATSVATVDGRVLTGLQVENTPQRIVLKTQGGKLEVIPRANVEEVKVSPLSLMPEDLEKQIKPQELVDLFAFLALDKPPSDPEARPIPGTPKDLPKPVRGGR
jgi:putative heme-binding domain-containing protein